MKATEILMQEHRVIEMVLDALEGIAAQAADRGRLDGEAANAAIDFIRNFADRCHHGKEEGQLFPALVKKGIPQESGPVGAMLAEHDEGRAYVKAMAESVTAAQAGDSTAIGEFCANAHGYVSLLRQHIRKEDHVLFRLADQVLDNEDELSLLAEYEHVEREHMGSGTHEKYLEVGRRLARQFVSPDRINEAAFAEQTTSCCHGHH